MAFRRGRDEVISTNYHVSNFFPSGLSLFVLSVKDAIVGLSCFRADRTGQQHYAFEILSSRAVHNSVVLSVFYNRLLTKLELKIFGLKLIIDIFRLHHSL